MRRFFTIITLLLLITNNIKAQGDVNILFLGNSYTAVNNLPQLVAKIAESNGKNVYFASSTPGGHLLLQHAENSTSLNLIKEGNWDYVVLQEQSQLPTIEYYRSYMEKASLSPYNCGNIQSLEAGPALAGQHNHSCLP